MMSLWDALRMNMMISYQELVRTFLKEQLPLLYHRGLYWHEWQNAAAKNIQHDG